MGVFCKTLVFIPSVLAGEAETAEGFLRLEPSMDKGHPAMRSFRYCVLLVVSMLFLGQPAAARVRVVTTTPDLAAIARAVGGDRVEVQSIVRGYQNPHDVQAKPSYMRIINRADLLVHTGLKLEDGWLPLLIQNARNPRISPGVVGRLDASYRIRVLGIPTGQVDRSMGDVHPEGNPHYMLDPGNGLIVAETIASQLLILSPEDAWAFGQNLKRFQEDLEQRIANWEDRAALLRGQKIVTCHRQWEYLADWLGLEIVDQVEDRPGIPPSPRHIAGVVSRMKSEHIQVLICANHVEVKPAQRVADQTGAKLLVLPASVEGETGIDTYADLFEVLVSRLEDAFDKR